MAAPRRARAVAIALRLAAALAGLLLLACPGSTLVVPR